MRVTIECEKEELIKLDNYMRKRELLSFAQIDRLTPSDRIAQKVLQIVYNAAQAGKEGRDDGTETDTAKTN